MSTIMVVDDKEMLRDSVAVTLQRSGYTVIAAPGGEQAIEMIAKRRPDAVVTDLKMPGVDGLELIGRVRQVDEDLPIVLMTAYGTVETAVRALKLGAFDYITKPFEGDELIIAVKRAIEHARVKRENQVLKLAASDDCNAGQPGRGPVVRGLGRLIGSGAPMEEVRRNLATLAGSQGTVLISGESGTGKEVVARAIHEQSTRAGEPFLAVNCAAMSESLLESELFGHEKGAFTGADRMRKGRFELAHRGTLLLDEISEIKPGLQAKLLRVLQERSFERVGSSTTISVDVRVIATTNRDLVSEVQSGSFRQDLYYRLNVLPVALPTLRERLDDVRELVPHFVEMICRREGVAPKTASAETLDLMARYHWPGNVRELQNLCERAVVLSKTDMIEPSLVRGWLGGDPIARRAQPIAQARPIEARPIEARPIEARSIESRPMVEPGPMAFAPTNGASSLAPSLHASNGARYANTRFDRPAHATGPGTWLGDGELKPLADIEREVIVETLERFNGHRQKTASALGIGVRTLGLKLKKWKQQQIVPESL